MTEAYPEIVRAVLDRGQFQPVRDGLTTVELIDAQFTIVDAVNLGAPIGVGRKLGRKMQLIDGLTNLSGRSYPDVWLAIAPFLERFSDVLNPGDPYTVRHRAGTVPWGRFFQGQYGPRIADQLERAVANLHHDPTSRQAVINVWDSSTDYNPEWRDRPCVSQIQFLIRNNCLEMFCTMRSNDIWTGLAYDVAQMGQVQAAAASVLGVDWGNYHHRAISLHAYEPDIPRLRGMVPGFNPREDPGPDWREVRYPSLGYLRERFCTLADMADNALANEQWPEGFEPENRVEEWYLRELRTAVVNSWA
jgi:thymidylate synthase